MPGWKRKNTYEIKNVTWTQSDIFYFNMSDIIAHLQKFFVVQHRVVAGLWSWSVQGLGILWNKSIVLKWMTVVQTRNLVQSTIWPSTVTPTCHCHFPILGILSVLAVGGFSLLQEFLDLQQSSSSCIQQSSESCFGCLVPQYNAVQFKNSLARRTPSVSYACCKRSIPLKKWRTHLEGIIFHKCILLFYC